MSINFIAGYFQGPAPVNGEVTAEAANAETENMETEVSSENQDPSPTSEATKMDTNESETQEGEKAAAPAAQPAQPKQTVKAVELQIDSKTSSFSQQLLHELTEREVSLSKNEFGWKI